MLKTSPAVFAVGNTYQIMVEVQQESLMSVKIADKVYYDESNGIMNSLSPLHSVSVPMEALDNAKAYTICTKCGKVTEVSNINITDNITKNIKKFHLTHYSLHLHGLCNKCHQAMKRRKAKLIKSKLQ